MGGMGLVTLALLDVDDIQLTISQVCSFEPV